MKAINNILYGIKDFYKRFEEKDISLIKDYNSCVRKISEEIEKKPDEWLLDNTDDLMKFVYKLKGLTKLLNIEFGDNKAISFNASNYTRLEEKMWNKCLEDRRSKDDLDF